MTCYRLVAMLAPCLLLGGVAVAQPEPVLVADLREVGQAERLLAVSLQGIAHQQPQGPRVFLLFGGREGDWLDYCLRLEPRPVEEVSVAQLLERLQPQVKGQILYDPALPETINVATTAAGLRQAVISDHDLGLPTVLDLRGRFRSASEAGTWARKTLLSECDHARAALLPPEAVALRDFAIQRRMFTFSAPAGDDAGFQEALARLPPGAAIYGQADPALRRAISAASHSYVSAAQAADLSFLSLIGANESYRQYRLLLDGSAPRYLALIFDCSDLGFSLNQLAAGWERTTRGALPVGWALPAALAEAAPPAVRRYYADAYRSGLDGFLLGPSGAGEIDMGLAGAPYGFYQATARAAARLDTRTALWALPAQPVDLQMAISRFAADTGLEGVFVVGDRDFAPVLLNGVGVVAAPRVQSVAAAIAYLDRIPLERRFAALCLDPGQLSLADAAHIAAHVSRRFAAATPEQLIELMRLPTQPGTATAAVSAVEYPERLDPEQPIPIKASIQAAGRVRSAAVVYRPAIGNQMCYQPLRQVGDGWEAELPPLLSGGELTASVRVVDEPGRASWSPTWTLQVPRADSDGDGLSDAEERFLLTNPASADSDRDGLRDPSDAAPARPDRVAVIYFGPLRPPSDLPYLVEPGASQGHSEGRWLAPGQSCTYWLPTARRPVGAPAVVALEAVGPARLATGQDPAVLQEEFSGTVEGVWHSAPLPEELPGGIFLRLTCPEDAKQDLLILGVAVLSPSDAPSVGSVGVFPAHPGPLQPITILATAFSPHEVEQVSLTYRINEGGTITVPMQGVPGTQRYQATLSPLENGDRLEWWVTARDRAGGATSTALALVSIGARSRETVALVASRDFVGDWVHSGDWDGVGRAAPAPGLRDSAAGNLTGGTYTVWALAGGRGQNIAVQIENKRLGIIPGDRPDGWHRVGRLKLEAGRYHLHLVAEPGPAAPPGAAPRYAAVVLSADPLFSPPPGQVLDVYNTLTLLSPRAGDALGGLVEVRATGAGNLTGVEVLLDGQVVRRVSGPPFLAALNTSRLANGPHILGLEGLDRAGRNGLSLAIPVTVANEGEGVSPRQGSSVE